jgi:hypothetical protein
MSCTGHNIQQHSVVQVRGGRAQDCPGVKYTLVRGAMDLVSIFFCFRSVCLSRSFTDWTLLGWCWKPYDESLEVRCEEAEDQLRWVRDTG